GKTRTKKFPIANMRRQQNYSFARVYRIEHVLFAVNAFDVPVAPAIIAMPDNKRFRRQCASGQHALLCQYLPLFIFEGWKTDSQVFARDFAIAILQPPANSADEPAHRARDGQRQHAESSD